MRPAPSQGIQPGQVLHRYVSVIFVSHGDDLIGDTLIDFVLDSSGLSADALSFDAQHISMVCPVVSFA